MTMSTDGSAAGGSAPAESATGAATRVRRVGRISRAGVVLALKLAPVGIMLVLAVIGPWIVPRNPELVAGLPSIPPNGSFWMGTDSAGLDVFSRVIAATRVNVLIGALVTVLATGSGILVGLAIGMNESRRGPIGWLARGLARAVDLLQALPAVIVGLVIVALYGPSVATMVVAIAVIIFPLQARLVRTEVLRVRSEAYIEAGRIAGLGEFRLIMRHVLPNSSWPALENTAFVFGVAVILTAALGFLGVGLPPPKPEWGSMLARGASDAAVGRWWSATFPTIALILAVSSVALAYSALFGKNESH
jgi:peptide/nickel transport system permease protein